VPALIVTDAGANFRSSVAETAVGEPLAGPHWSAAGAELEGGGV
jgi:hypothetical protein